MDFVFFAAAWLLGGFIGVFTLGQVLIILRFGLPTAIRWYRAGWLTAVRPISKYVLSLVNLSGMFVAATWAVLRFFPSYKDGYFIGLGIALLYAIRKSGATNDNIADFVQSNLSYINHSEIETLIEKLGIADKLKGEASRRPEGGGQRQG